MKTHYITDIIEGFNYILACGLKYKDSDNYSFTKTVNEITCKKCLKEMKKMVK